MNRVGQRKKAKHLPKYFTELPKHGQQDKEKNRQYKAGALLSTKLYLKKLQERKVCCHWKPSWMMYTTLSFFTSSTNKILLEVALLSRLFLFFVLFFALSGFCKVDGLAW